MDKLVYLLPVLGCVAMMGVMMLMMRGGHANHGTPAAPTDPATREEIAMLRAEIATLRSAQTPPPAAADRDTVPKRGGAA